MAVPMLTRSSDKIALERRAKQLRLKRQLILCLLAVMFVMAGVFVFRVGRNRAPQPGYIRELPQATLLNRNNSDSVISVSEIESEESAERNLTENDETRYDDPDLSQPLALLPSEDTLDVIENKSQMALPENLPFKDYSKLNLIPYHTQSGDTLKNISERFDVATNLIRGAEGLSTEKLLPTGHLLYIPSRLTVTSGNTLLFPDSEVLNSPSAVAFDARAFIQAKAGYLSDFSELLEGVGTLSGAEIIQKIANDYSIHPRLLIALLEHESQWLSEWPESPNERAFPLGMIDFEHPGLYQQLKRAARQMSEAYYGWRKGVFQTLYFADGQSLQLSPELNAGSVAIMNFYARNHSMTSWSERIYGENSFFKTYQNLFGDPWSIAAEFEVFLPAELNQAEFSFPFDRKSNWNMKSGPHPVPGAESVNAGLEFTPPKVALGCGQNFSWILSASRGLVVRSEDGIVVIDVDRDGHEETGWSIVYFHVSELDRIPVGHYVQIGSRIGHPSCEGGPASMSHFRIARKYNGEWIAADGPVPFVLDEWCARPESEVGHTVDNRIQMLKDEFLDIRH